MKQLFLFILSLTLTLNALATEGFTYKLNKNQKMISTFSGDIDQKTSVHFITVKNKETRKHDIIPFYTTADNKLIELNTISYKKLPNILSYHINDGKLVLFVKEPYIGGIEYTVVDIDLATKTNTKVEFNDYSNFRSTVVRLPNKTLILKNGKEFGKLDLSVIKNSTNFNTYSKTIEGDDRYILRDMFKDAPDVVNSNTFVENGSINKSSIYVNGNQLYVENFNKKTKTSNILNFDIDHLNELNFKALNNDDIEKIKDNNSFIHNKNLYSVFLDKKTKDAVFKVTNIENGKSKFKASLQNELAKHLNEENVTDFLKQAKKNSNKPTFTANTTKDNNIVMNISYVNTATYYYNDFWWHHHMWHMHFQNQQMINNIRNNMNQGYGPNPANLEFYSFEKEEKKSMQIVINSNFEILKNASTEGKRPNFDTDEYLEEFKDDKKVKNLSASFLTDSYTIMYYDKKSKEVRFKSGLID